jgi:chaperone BCS1
LTKTLQQPSWGRSREFEITTRAVNRSGVQSTGELEDDEEDDGDDRLNHGRSKRTVAFMPSIGEQL